MKELTYDTIDTNHKNFGRWLQFHWQNPHVYETIIDVTRRAKLEHRYTQWSMQGVFEILRWNQLLIVHKSIADYKLCHNYRSFYSRLVMENEPDLAGFFSIRESGFPNEPSTDKEISDFLADAG